jgi:hypothetical protein
MMQTRERRDRWLLWWEEEKEEKEEEWSSRWSLVFGIFGQRLAVLL